VGLDATIMELEARGMVASMVLNNAWPSSGGFAQYIVWAGGHAPPMPASAERLLNGFTWDRLHFFESVSRFFEMPEAVRLSHQHIRTLLSRRNSLTGRLYASDPTIMSWELANEPRAMSRRAAYRAWVISTSQLVKKLAPNHLVTIGSEGSHADLAERWQGKGEASGWQAVETATFETDHALQSIDYATCHLWPEPWGWYDQDPKHGGGSGTVYTHLLERAKQYMQAHVQAAARIGKPLVIAEVGLARDSNRYGAMGAVDHRNKLLQSVLNTMQASVDGRDALAGVGFSGWAGEGRRKQHAASESRVRDTAASFRVESNVFDDSVYDNSVYDKDLTTVRLISSYAVRWRSGNGQR
jgi:mannan endo-1,4-beta-mannosidase